MSFTFAWSAPSPASRSLPRRGSCGFYGVATWNGFRDPRQLDFERLAEIADRLAGAANRFRFIQLPFNLTMTEAFTNGLLERAARAGITVVASASILQGRLASNGLPALDALLPGLETPAQRAIQFTRSTPGITTALVGMSSAAHVAENLALARVPPLAPEAYSRIYDH